MNRSGIQWWKFQLHSTGTPLTYSASGVVFDSAASSPCWYYTPSLAVNWQNEMLLGFSGSSSNTYISAYYVGRMADGTMLGPPVLIRAGATAGGNPWGDYSFATVDPIDNQTFWTVQGFASSVSPYPWADWVVSVRPGP